jgi:hypothetical protein
MPGAGFWRMHDVAVWRYQGAPPPLRDEGRPLFANGRRYDLRQAAEPDVNPSYRRVRLAHLGTSQVRALIFLFRAENVHALNHGSDLWFARLFAALPLRGVPVLALRPSTPTLHSEPECAPGRARPADRLA